MSNSLSGWETRQRRYSDMVMYEEQTVSDRVFNLIMGGVVLYGLAVNFILCATIGADIYYAVNPILFLIAYLVLCFGGVMIATRSEKPIISFLGYNMVVLPIGIVVSACVEGYGGISSSVVSGAFFYTMLITAIMVLASSLLPDFFARIGGALFTCLFGLVICGILMMFIPALGNIYSFFAALIFSLYIGYDYYRAQQFAPTVDNAVDCALDIYLDIINLFLQLLRILSKSDRNSRNRV